MPLQSEQALSMTTLGMLGDVPADPLQPPLVDAMHLRWSFGAARSFPWYGYYLFRRLSRREQAELRCVLPQLRVKGIAGPSELHVTLLETTLGNFTSDRDLIVTDDFPTGGVGELDLRGRSFLRFTFAEPMFFVSYQVGLRKDTVDGALRCISFQKDDSVSTANPKMKDGVRFTVYERDDKVSKSTRVLINKEGSPMLHLGYRTRVELPCSASALVVTVANYSSEGKVVGVDIEGREVVSQALPRGDSESVTVELKGEGIVEVFFLAPGNETFLLRLCYLCDQGGKEGDIGLHVRFYSGGTILHEEPVVGSAGDIVHGKYTSDLITAIEFSGGDAAVVDICGASVDQALNGGWEPVERCPQPLALPVFDPEYPASGGKPADIDASRKEAISRIRYGDPADWDGTRFDLMHTALQEIVDLGPAGPDMKDIGSDNVPASAGGTPTLARLRPMNYLLMGALYAPIAQMLGLYWADETAGKNIAYDYLIIADHADIGKGNASDMLAWFNSPSLNFNDIDAWVCFNRTLGSPAPLSPPWSLRAYALPGTTAEQTDGTLRDLTNNAGLTWELQQTASGKLQSGAPTMYVIRRSERYDMKPAGPIPTEKHKAINDIPHVVTRPPNPSTVVERPAHWPAFPLHYTDSGLEEGWYSYRVNGVDLFGRYSAASAPAAWFQWSPPPDPRPWYYLDGKGSTEVHAYAISLLDKVPPPPPTAVEGMVLDPKDPDLLRDAAYESWFMTLSTAERDSVVGLRVRWMWTWSQMRQAPDTREFRVYWRGGQPNVYKGRVGTVKTVDAAHSIARTDISHSAGANAFVGAYLRAAGRSFRITGSSAGSPLEVTVENLLPDHSLKPETGAKCSISIPPGHTLYSDISEVRQWEERVWVVPYSDYTALGVIPASVPGGSGDQLAGNGAAAIGNIITLPAGTDISAIRPYDFHLYLSEDTARPSRIYRIISVNPAAKEVTLDGAPVIAGGSSGWEIGLLTQRYEFFLPAPGDAERIGIGLSTSAIEPIAYGVVGVTAVDDKDHTVDNPKWSGKRWGDRAGNESRMGGPATVFRVHRTAPQAPEMPPDSADVYASRADYHGKSYYTFRWVPQAGVDTHIFRALDQSIFQRDWLIRSTRAALTGSATVHREFFPAGWTEARRNAAAASLNAIGGPGQYGGLTADALEVLGRLPGNEGFRSRGELNQRDWLIRRTRGGLGSGDLTFFPADWNSADKRRQAANQLNAIGGIGDYEALGNDALRVLAALPGNEAAYQQITDRPLPNAGPITANRLGPDNPAGFPVNPALRAFVDAIDGRSTNKYFYRAAFIDAAQNVGELGLASPPVRVPDVLPPRTPVFSRVLAGDPTPGEPGDRKITLRWVSGREPDLAAYRIYRTEEEPSSRDVRLMDLVHEFVVPAGDPALRPQEVLWLDQTVRGLVTYYYRLVAVDKSGNLSAASAIVAARAYDTALPEPPELSVAWVEQGGRVRAEISWTSPHEVMIQRKNGASNWIDLAQWRAPGAVVIRDPFSNPAASYQYRAVVRKYTGAIKRGEPILIEAEE
ncbi:hypothetical protein [Paenibacillus ginsengarvi]|uniref:Fibronectin type-III domain-containing protein n=1 Tax=Paenibacillus ginsengarvi TaxID=400777 RepID=A0A3B0BB37_9BACL|nr:hypothetical protein [Paenibacillus ginsengarvi]RKN70082.1 hypothetical protein D7M11_31145 [Paenibacillus ginsengarvi]